MNSIRIGNLHLDLRAPEVATTGCIAARLDAKGNTALPQSPTQAACTQLIAMYGDDARSRSRVVMRGKRRQPLYSRADFP